MKKKNSKLFGDKTEQRNQKITVGQKEYDLLRRFDIRFREKNLQLNPIFSFQTAKRDEPHSFHGYFSISYFQRKTR